ncbi:MAG: Gldg family protein [Planctomycetota bacterium]
MRNTDSPKWRILTRSIIAIGVLLFIAGLTLRDISLNAPFSLSQLGFYLGIGGLILTLAGIAANFKSIAAALSRTRKAESANVVVSCILAIILVGLICYMSNLRYMRLDWTGHRFYSLQSRTLRMLDHLEQPIEITIIYQRPHQKNEQADPDSRLVHWGYQQSQKMLDEFASRSSRINVRRLDLSDPEEVSQLGEQYDLPERCILFESGDSHNIVPLKQLVRASGRDGGQLQFNGEAAFVSALLKLTEDYERTVYFLTGNGERPLHGKQAESEPQALSTEQLLSSTDYSLEDLETRLKTDNYAVEELNLATTDTIPDDCDVLIAAGPRSPLPGEQIETIQDYLKGQDGRLIVMADSQLQNPHQHDFTLNEILEDYGMRARTKALGMFQYRRTDNRPDRQEPAHPRVLITQDGYANHPITRDLQNYNLVFVHAAPLEIVNEQPIDGLKTSPLLTGTNATWGETTDTSKIKEARYDPDRDIPGPLLTAAICEPDGQGKSEKDDNQAPPESNPRIVVFGSSLSFVNKVAATNIANHYVLLNAINWLAGRKQLVGIPPKDMDIKLVNLSGEHVRLAQWIFMLGLPACFIVLGICVWRLRKR